MPSSAKRCPNWPRTSSASGPASWSATFPCTGHRPWRPGLTFADLLAGPEVFRSFAPRWEPLLWSLEDQSPEALLNTAQEWLQALAVVRAEEADTDTFQRVFAEVLRRLQGLHGRDPVRWFDLMRFVLTWASWRRPRPEREVLLAVAPTLAPAGRQEEVRTVTQTIRESYIEEGRNEGVKQGVIEGIRRSILRLGRKKLGEPPAEVVAALNGLTDLERLEQVLDRVGQVADWQGLLASLSPSSGSATPSASEGNQRQQTNPH